MSRPSHNHQTKLNNTLLSKAMKQQKSPQNKPRCTWPPPPTARLLHHPTPLMATMLSPLIFAPPGL